MSKLQAMSLKWYKLRVLHEQIAAMHRQNAHLDFAWWND